MHAYCIKKFNKLKFDKNNIKVYKEMTLKKKTYFLS